METEAPLVVPILPPPTVAEQDASGIVSVWLPSGRKITVDSTVLVKAADDEFGIPYVAVIKRIYQDELDGLLKMNVLWLYHACELKKKPPGGFITCPARFEGPQDEGREDAGDLKEVFMSCHPETVLVATVMHPARVFFLPTPNKDDVARVWTACNAGGTFLPGFVCRRFVDVSDWSFHSLKSVAKKDVLENPEDTLLIQRLLQHTEDVLAGTRWMG